MNKNVQTSIAGATGGWLAGVAAGLLSLHFSPLIVPVTIMLIFLLLNLRVIDRFVATKQQASERFTIISVLPFGVSFALFSLGFFLSRAFIR